MRSTSHAGKTSSPVKRKVPASGGRRKSAKKPRGEDGEDGASGSGSDASDSDSDFEGPKKGGGSFTKPVRLSEALAAVVGAGEMSRPQLTKTMFAYFNEHGLKDASDKRYVNCDAKLKELFGVDRFLAFGVQKMLAPHILKD